VAYEYKRVVQENVFITKWPNELERYVKYDKQKEDYLKVDLDKAQVFNTREEAEKFANEVYDFGYDKPEIVVVEVKPIA
jgi:3-isopropylmalate dehydratase small subunit